MVEPPKRIVPSVIRLGCLDDVYSRLRRSVYFSRRAGFKSLGEGLDVFPSGEFSVLGDFIPLGFYQLAHQQIECGAKVVDSVTEDGTPPERRLVRSFNFKNQVARIKLAIAEDSIGFGLFEPLYSGFKIIYVLFGPFDLYPDATKVGLASHWF